MKIPNKITTFFNTRKIRLGGKELSLNLHDHHEKKYFEAISSGKKVIDQLIVESFLRASDVVLDAGANIGFSSLLFLENGASRVYAFEPVPKLYHRLNMLRGDDLEVFCLALSDDNCNDEILLSISHNQGHTLNPQWEKMFPLVYGDRRSVCVVKKAKLDDLFPDRHFDYMKVDIEGSEEAFLRGSSKTLSKHPPRILQIEIYPEMFTNVHHQLKKYFKYIKRAIVNKRFSSLELIDIWETDKLENRDFEVCPPTFLCTNNPLLLTNENNRNRAGQVQNGYFVLDEFASLIFGGACLQKVLDEFEFQTVLDIGSGSGIHAKIFKKYGKDVTQVDFGESCYYEEGKESDRNVLIGDYLSFDFKEKFDLIWASHVLEHQLNVNFFLKKIFKDLKDRGILAITVPPLKDEIVGGHLSIWNAGLLLYNLVLAGFNCKDAKVLKYGYNISIIVPKIPVKLPKLDYDKGDIEKLLDYFPDDFSEPFQGDISQLNW